MQTEKKLAALKARLQEVYDLNMVASLLAWDQSTYMPSGGARGRARQQGLISKLSHERATDPEIGHLLDDLEAYGRSLPYDSDDAALIRVARHDYERDTRVPASFVEEFTGHTALTYQAWTVARPNNDFATMRPLLEKNLDLSRQLADFFPGYKHIADPLIDLADPGMTASAVRDLFSALKEKQIPIVKKIISQTVVDDSCIRQNYPEIEQITFGTQVVKQLGYDFQRGRIDKTHHPFMTKFSLGDIRITTRVRENDLSDNFFSLIHESGHAMYEQGIRMELDGTPLAGGTSAGVHESQSRLWENLVGRSRIFWEYFYPKIQTHFPEQLGSTHWETFYRAINKVEPSLIRTDADEVTYNLHVMLRFDLELALLEGKLEVKDLPEVWNQRFYEDFGIQVPDNRDGVLQDVHWYSDVIGGHFQGYTLGNILSAQLFAAALQAQPEILTEIGEGIFDSLRGWLTVNVYQHGRKFTAPELVERITGGSIRIEPYIEYLKNKYGELYYF